MKQPTAITATDMHKRRGAIIRQCFRNGEHFIVERDGIPLVAIIPISEYQARYGGNRSGK